MSRLSPSRRVLALACAVVAVAGLSTASAAQLGVNGGTLQSGVGAVTDCQPAGKAITIRPTSTFSSGAYRTAALTVSGVDAACQGLKYRVQVLSSTGAAIDMNGSAAGTDVGGTVSLVNGAFSVAFTSTPTAGIARVALVISG